MLNKILKPLSSLAITCVLIALAMFLIYVGTTAQMSMGIHQVQKKFFHTFFCWVDFQNLFPHIRPSQKKIPGGFPMLGGYTIGGLMLLNLLAAHITRFRITLKALGLTLLILIPMIALFWVWYYQDGGIAALAFSGGLVMLSLLVVTLFSIYQKRAGVILIHMGVILLLAGEGVASKLQQEGQMPIDEGSYANWAQDIRHVELAIVQENPSQAAGAKDTHTVIAAHALRKDAKLKDPAKLPFEIVVNRYFPNSKAVHATSAPDMAAVTDDDGTRWTVVERPVIGGTEGEKVDMPSVFVTLYTNDGKPLGAHLFTVMNEQPEPIRVGDKTYNVSLRFKRDYKPYTIHLKDFAHDRYQGTEVARNFSSDVILIDPTKNERREVRIAMNSPLRYGGETFFQASFRPGDKTTILQVVRNPGAMFPYTAIFIAGFGLCVHFSQMLLAFLLRRQMSKQELVAIYGGTCGFFTLGTIAYFLGGLWGLLTIVFLGVVFIAVLVVRYILTLDQPRPSQQIDRPGKKRDANKSYELPPAKKPVLVPAIVLGLCIFYVVSHAFPRPYKSQYDLDTFATIPVSFDGRTQPLDSLARNALKMMRGRESALLIEGEGKDKKETKLKPVEWLIENISNTDTAYKAKVILLDHPEVKSFMGVDVKQKYFSAQDLGPNAANLQQQATTILKTIQNDKDRNHYQRSLVELFRRMQLQGRLSLSGIADLYAVPPLDGGKDWRTIGEVGREAPETASTADMHPSVHAFIEAVRAKRDNNPAQFNRIVQKYDLLLKSKVPEITSKASFETWFNRFDPWMMCIVLYIGAFLFAVFSWLTWTKPLARAAFWILALSLVVHTFWLIGRIYISGRPPVTNLASSAIFIGWGAAIFAAVLELIFRNGIGTVAASVIAIPTLYVAHRLSLTGDTMAVLVAVLDTNIWLATHVIVITLGYAASLLAGMIGIIYIVTGLFSPALSNKDTAKTLVRMIYAVTCFALLCSFVGTILGGIWADQSWGRFWGWDPKENGAVLLVLANALVLHARWAGVVKDRGFAILAIFGAIVMLWSWFGTNLLGEGLHAYGFMESGWFKFGLAIAGMMLFVFMGLIPQEYWRSFKSDPNRAQPVLPPKPSGQSQ